MNFLATTILVCAFSALCAGAAFALSWVYIQGEKRRMLEARRLERRKMRAALAKAESDFGQQLNAARDSFTGQLETVSADYEKKYQTVARAVYELQGGDTGRKHLTGLQAKRQEKQLRLIQKEIQQPKAVVG